MTIYICPNCKKDFKQKINFINHTINKKIPCKVITDLINTKKLTENIVNLTENIVNLTENTVDLTENTINLTENTINLTEIKVDLIENTVDLTENKENKLLCQYCNNLFSRKDYLQLHIKKYCKSKKHIEELDKIKSKINIDVHHEKYEELLEKFNTLMTVCNEYEKIIKGNNLLQQSIPCMTNNNTDNSVTNNAINNGIVNNANIHTGNTINIVQFGKEDISKCNLIEMMNIYLKSTGGNIFSNILKYLNFNPSYPENFNILMSDLARENVKIHNGKKFVTKKFRTVKNDILTVLNSHIANMCETYIDNPKTKKNDDILNKIKINDISVKLINDDDITPLLKNKKEIIYDSDGNELEPNSDDESDIDDLNFEAQQKLTHYEKKRLGLQEITIQKLKDELYNNRELVFKELTC